MSIALLLHVLSAVVWVGGMFFAYMVLRPVAASRLEPPQRLPLWAACFNGFFFWVWLAVVALPLSGYWMALTLFGGLMHAPHYVLAMTGVGSVMILLYLWLYFVPYRALKDAVRDSDWKRGGAALARIRRLVGTNLLLGLVTVAVAAAGRYLG